jgi:glucokinase
METKKIISVDLGGTKILSALVNSKNEIVSRVKIPTDPSKGKESLLKGIAASVEQLLGENQLTQSDIKAISLGVPGTVNPYTGIIGDAPNLGIKNFNIKEGMAKYVNIPVLIENDVNLAGLGIKRFEYNGEVNNMLVIFVGTGIGGALFFDGKIYRGSSFYAGEIGHIHIDPKGNFSNKSRTTFELSAGRPAIVKGITKDIKNGKKSVLKEYITEKKSIKSKALLNALKKKDKVAIQHINNAADIIGTVLGNVTTILNLDTIVVGGGVVEAMHSYFIPRIKKTFKENVLKESGAHVKINYTKLGDDAPLFGGIALAEEFLK